MYGLLGLYSENLEFKAMITDELFTECHCSQYHDEGQTILIMFIDKLCSLKKESNKARVTELTIQNNFIRAAFEVLRWFRCQFCVM